MRLDLFNAKSIQFGIECYVHQKWNTDLAKNWSIPKDLFHLKIIGFHRDTENYTETLLIPLVHVGVLDAIGLGLRSTTDARSPI